jgi:hypothetical protein
MATDKQIAANRLNALKSTGPRSAEGKARAARNAVRHGLLARDLLLESEDADTFERFSAGVSGQLDPVGELERELASQIISAAWRLRRVVRMETEMMEADMVRETNCDRKRLRNPSGHDTERTERLVYSLGHAVSNDIAHYDTYSRIWRYESQLHGRMLRNLRELGHLQDVRAAWDADGGPDALDEAAPEGLSAIAGIPNEPNSPVN